MDILHSILTDDPKVGMMIIANLILLESILSIDNAAVLATMVLDLPPEQRSRALSYGILGAYVFRGICLLFAGYLIKISWLKAMGGIYLIWLFASHFKDILRYGNKGYNFIQVLTIGIFLALDKSYGQWALIFKGILLLLGISIFWGMLTSRDSNSNDPHTEKREHPVFQFFHNKIGMFWSSVILIEIMDLAFSIDNVFAAVAFTNNIVLICIGVFIGILAMRFVAQFFVQLLERFTMLKDVAFMIIGILGFKLLASYACDLYPLRGCNILESHEFDLGVSIFTVCLFIVPIVFGLMFGKKNAR